MPIINHIASGLQSFHDCQRRAATKLHYREVVDAGYNLNETNNKIITAIGTAMHAGAKYLLDEKIEGNIPNINIASDVTIDALNSECEGEVEYEIEISNRNKAEKMAVDLTKKYYLDVLDDIDPKRTERPMTIIIGDYEMRGRLDVEEKTGGIRDLKTRGRVSYDFVQLGVYSFAKKNITKNPTPALISDVIIRGKNLQYKKIEYNVDLCEKEALSLIVKVIEAHKKFLTTGNCREWICNPASNLCSSKFCNAFGTNFCEVTIYGK